MGEVNQDTILQHQRKRRRHKIKLAVGSFVVILVAIILIATYAILSKNYYLVQPKNVFLSVITSDSKISAIGDLIYGYICLTIYGINIKNFLIFTFFSIIGGIIVTAFAGIVGSLSFWIVKGDAIADVLNNASIHFDTYPGTIFDGGIKILLYTILPVGIANYMPFEIMLRFDFIKFIIVIIFTVCISIFAFIVFNKGLKRYSSSNLMSAKI